MKGTILIVCSAIIFSGVLATSKVSSQKSVRATPEEFHAAAVTASEGIAAALLKAGQDIEAVLSADEELAGSVHLILDLAYNNAAGVLIPALDSLAAATTDEDAKEIVLNTISDLMIIGLGTEFRIEDALIGTSQEIHEQVTAIGTSLTRDIKTQIRPLWDLVEATRH